MKISGFTFVRNADKFYFPIKESILSILPIVDEFVIALGDNDDDDRTEALIQEINSPKIKLIKRVWSEQYFIDGRIYREETNFALSHCSGDWCFYLQADEVVHEQDLPIIVESCEKYLNNKNVEGFLFHYNHFWGDYNHYLPFHGWYRNEIRLVRNNIGVESIKDAQSFRINGTRPLKVKPIEAYIYHYGWVRPPRVMQSKKKDQDGVYWGEENAEKEYAKRSNNFDYGALGKVPEFPGAHPDVMKEYMTKLDWQDELNYSKKADLNRDKFKHEKLKYQLITYIENTFFNKKEVIGYKNWKIIE